MRRVELLHIRCRGFEVDTDAITHERALDDVLAQELGGALVSLRLPYVYFLYFAAKIDHLHLLLIVKILGSLT